VANICVKIEVEKNLKDNILNLRYTTENHIVQIHFHIVIYNAASEKIKTFVLLNIDRMTNAKNARFSA
jgi:hypothetical protein